LLLQRLGHSGHVEIDQLDSGTIFARPRLDEALGLARDGRRRHPGGLVAAARGGFLLRLAATRLVSASASRQQYRRERHQSSNAHPQTPSCPAAGAVGDRTTLSGPLRAANDCDGTAPAPYSPAWPNS